MKTVLYIVTILVIYPLTPTYPCLPRCRWMQWSPVSIQTQSLALRALHLEGNRAKRNRLRWQAANHGCHCFDRASYWLQGLRLARFPSKHTQRKRLRLDGNRAWDWVISYNAGEWMNTKSLWVNVLFRRLISLSCLASASFAAVDLRALRLKYEQNKQ